MTQLALPTRSHSRTVLTGGLLALVTLLSGCFSHSLGFKSTASESLSAATPGQRLTIRNEVGRVTLLADASASGVTVEVEKVGKGSSQAEADKALGEIVVSLAPHPSQQGTLEGSVSHPHGMRRRGYEVNWVVTAPPSVALYVVTDVGQIDAQGFTAGGQFKSDVGEIKVAGFEGAVDARNDVGDIRVSTTGPVTIRSDVGDVVAHAKGDESHSITIQTDVGAVTLHIEPQWTGKLRASTDVGAITLAALPDVREVERNRHRIVAEVGAGASQAQIDITTEVGSVTIAGPSPVGADPSAGSQQQQ